MALPTRPDLYSTVSAVVLEALKAGEMAYPVNAYDPFLNHCLNDAKIGDTLYEWKTASGMIRDPRPRGQSITGRVQKLEPEYQRLGERFTVRSHLEAIASTDLSKIEGRAMVHYTQMLDDFFALGLTTNQLPQEEPEPLTLEKLNALMVQYGLLPAKPKDSWLSPYWGIPFVRKDKRLLFDIETVT